MPMNITISNLWVDSFAGTVPRRTYEYFKQQKIDLKHYLFNGFIGDLDTMPIKYQFIRHGNLHKACNLWQQQGLLLDGATELLITHNNEEIFNQRPYLWGEPHNEIQFEFRQTRLCDLKIKSNQAVFISGIFNVIIEEKRRRDFFKGKIPNADIFEPNKLKIYYHDILGTKLIEKVAYDGELIIPIDEDLCTLDQWQRAWWYLPHGELPYDIDDRFTLSPLGYGW